MNQTTEITAENVCDFLKKFATDISIEELKPVSKRHRGGDNFTFYYRDDAILKVARNAYRARLLKEVKLTEYLHALSMPFTVAKPIMVHDKGFYAMFSRIDGTSLPIEALEGFTPKELEAFGKSLGTSLTFLHRHKFPDEVLDHIPRAADPFAVAIRDTRQQLAFIAENTTEIYTSRWSEKLENLQERLNQRWAVVHTDLQINHLFFLQENLEQLAIIDWADTVLHDPAIDLSEFAIEMYSDLPPDGIVAKRVIDVVLKYYQTDDDAITEKIEFGLLIFQIWRAYQWIKNLMNQSY
ncbi:MAG: aminoglycoside phosphotransferase family protein [Candidatus Poribacteria bacterium]|nr:aminoglycoside phosphotransferase family protein [Candidatus Poribacteria bacterium]